MLPMVGVPKTVRKGLHPYRDLFRRDEGFEYVSRYVTGWFCRKVHMETAKLSLSVIYAAKA
jgi:hypothetical protein